MSSRLDISYFLRSNSCKDTETFQPRKDICFSLELFLCSGLFNAHIYKYINPSQLFSPSFYSQQRKIPVPISLPKTLFFPATASHYVLLFSYRTTK